jgi:restriction endonuclease S subunit
LSGELIKGFIFDFPTYKEQESIADFLWTIDEKIAINSALSKTLEDIAQAIFKSWFIDFDPVRAKMVGEKPAGMDDATAALFPDSMGDSELGFIPNSWEVAPIGDVLVVGGGTTPSTTNAEYWDGEHCWTTPKDLSSQRGLITTSSIRKISDLGLAQISSGLLPVNSVLMSCRAPIGYVSINAVPTAVNKGFITLKNSAEYHPIYLLNWINANIQEIHNRAGGATFAEITRKAFREIPFLKPSPQVVKRYSEIVEPIVLELEQLTRQIENLQVVRDLLLPRLVSGELQIPEEMLAS